MFAAFRSLLRPFAAAVLAVAAFAAPASAGWVTIRNDTKKVMGVRESVSGNGEYHGCKPVRLLPGEAVKQYIPGPTTRKVEVFDGQNPTQPLHSGTLSV